jgi:K+-sensing histidine kinase KdpD
MKTHGIKLVSKTLLRYSFSLVAVAGVLTLRMWLVPLTGPGAPFVLFFAAVLVISVFAGVGPGLCTVVLSTPLAAYMFAVPAPDILLLKRPFRRRCLALTA